MDESDKRVLTVIGNIGSGKSTLTPILTKVLGATAIDADDLFQTSDPFARRFLKDISRWGFTNEVWMTLARVQLIRSQIHKATTEWVVIDSGLVMSWVYTYGHFAAGKIDSDEWQLYQDLYSELTKDISLNAIVYLDYENDVLLDRIKKRGREYELEFYKKDYLDQITQGLQHYIETQSAAGKISKTNNPLIDFTKDTKNTKKEVLRLLQEII